MVCLVKIKVIGLNKNKLVQVRETGRVIHNKNITVLEDFL